MRTRNFRVRNNVVERRAVTKGIPNTLHLRNGMTSSKTSPDRRSEHLLLISTLSFSPSTSLFPLLLSSRQPLPLLLFTLHIFPQPTAEKVFFVQSLVRTEQVSVFFGQSSSILQTFSFLAMFHNPFCATKPLTSKSSRTFAFLPGDPSFLPFNVPSSRILARTLSSSKIKIRHNIFPILFRIHFLWLAKIHQLWSQSLPRITRPLSCPLKCDFPHRESKVFRAHAAPQGTCDYLINALKLLTTNRKMVTIGLYTHFHCNCYKFVG